MKIDEVTRNKIKALPPVLRMAAEALLAAVSRLADGECDETEIMQAMSAIESSSRGRYGDDDLVTYDKVMKMLGIGDRNHLKRILDENGVTQVTIHNQKVGFPRSGILAVKERMRKNGI